MARCGCTLEICRNSNLTPKLFQHTSTVLATTSQRIAPPRMSWRVAECIDANTYSLLCSLTPTKPQDKSYEKLAIMHRHCSL